MIILMSQKSWYQVNVFFLIMPCFTLFLESLTLVYLPPQKILDTMILMVSLNKKKAYCLEKSDNLLSTLGAKHMSSETKVIARIVATTFLPLTGSFSTLSQQDTFFTYCLLFKYKIKISFFIINYMIEASLDLPVFLMGLLSLVLLKPATSLKDVSSVPVKQCYNNKAFIIIGYVLIHGV